MHQRRMPPSGRSARQECAAPKRPTTVRTQAGRGSGGHVVQRDRLQWVRCRIPATEGCLICPPPIADWWAVRSQAPAPRSTTVCFPAGSCCLDDGTCVEPTTPEDCTTAGGVFQGNETDCVSTDCPDPEGACCVPATGACVVLTNTNCGVVGGQYSGDGTVCENACETNCPEDLDGSGEVDFGDLIQLLSAFGPCVGCIEDLDNSNEVNFSDLLSLLSVWGKC